MTEDVVTVKVTLESIYLKLLEVDKKVDPLPAQHIDHETRLLSIEKRMWLWMGASAIAGGTINEIAGRFIGAG